MAIGLTLNAVSINLGIGRPISSFPVTAAISLVVLLLCVASYVRDRRYDDDSAYLEVRRAVLLPALGLCFVILDVVVGTYFLNTYNSNIILLLVIAFLAAIIVAFGYAKHVPSELYAFAVAAIAISLLLHTSLVSMQVWGWDIQVEYYFSNLVLADAHWNPTISNPANGVLSVVVLAPILNCVSGIDLTWIFKFVYPLLFSLLPIGMFDFFKKQTSDKIAFLSVVFFVSTFVFYTEMIALVRQQIAEVFMILILMVTWTEDGRSLKTTFLLISFTFALVVSHYASSYFFLFLIVLSWIPRRIGSKRLVRYAREMRFQFTAMYVFLLFVSVVAWYSYVSSSSAFGNVVFMIQRISSSFLGDFLSPEKAQGLALIVAGSSTPLGVVVKYLELMTLALISVGFLGLMRRNRVATFNKEYEFLMQASYFILLAAVSVPYFSSSLNTSRLYHICLIILAPLCVIGWVESAKSLMQVARRSWSQKSARNVLGLLSIFLAAYLLFNTGFVSQIVTEDSTSIALNPNVDAPLYNDMELQGAQWIVSHKGGSPLYSDSYRWQLILRLDWNGSKTLPTNANEVAYVYLGSLNVRDQKVLIPESQGVLIQYAYMDSHQFTSGRDAIFDNGGSMVYLG